MAEEPTVDEAFKDRTSEPAPAPAGPIKVRAYMIQCADSGEWIIFGESTNSDFENRKKIASSYWDAEPSDAHAIIEFEVPRMRPAEIPVITVKL